MKNENKEDCNISPSIRDPYKEFNMQAEDTKKYRYKTGNLLYLMVLVIIFSVQGKDISTTINNNFFRVLPNPYRLWENSAILPQQQVNIINDISKTGNLGLSAKISSNDQDLMIKNLKKSNQVQIVTFIWIGSKPPTITHGEETIIGCLIMI